MSLFSSAFNSSAGAGPSFSAPAKGQSGQKKRKRPSTDGKDDISHVDKDGQLRSTQANLQKLMKRVDAFSAPSREGGENMGAIKKKKNKGKKEHSRVEMDTPRKSSPAAIKAKNSREERALHSSATTSSPKVKPRESKPLKESGAGVEPAELPLPHKIKTQAHDSGEEEGLTKMQRDMKAKLEGARFRSVLVLCAF